MRTFVPSKIAVPLHLAVLVAYLASRRIAPGDVMAYLPAALIAAGLVVVAALFPAARRGEGVDDARKRVALAFRKDHVTFFGFFAICFVLLQTLNGPRVLRLDARTLEWGFSIAPIRDFPSCFDRLLSLDGAFSLLLVFTAMLVVRDSLGRNGRRILLEQIAAISAALALLGLVSYALAPAEAPAGGFATFADPVAAGVYFVMVFSVACGLLTTELGQKAPSRKKTRFLFVSAVLLFLGAVFSLSALALALAAGVLVVNLAYGLFFLRERALAEKRARLFAVAVVLLAVAAFLHFIAYPGNRVHARIERVFSGPWRTDAQKAEARVMRSVAWRTFSDNRFAGVGTWGCSDPGSFARHVESLDEWEALGDQETRRYSCGNDLLQCLAEYGSLGCLLMAIPFLALLGGIARRIVCAANRTGRAATRGEDGDEDFFDRFPPLAVSLLLAVATAGATSFVFSVFHQPLVFLFWTIALACLFCSLPKPPPKDVARKQRAKAIAAKPRRAVKPADKPAGKPADAAAGDGGTTGTATTTETTP